MCAVAQRTAGRGDRGRRHCRPWAVPWTARLGTGARGPRGPCLHPRRLGLSGPFQFLSQPIALTAGEGVGDRVLRAGQAGREQACGNLPDHYRESHLAISGKLAGPPLPESRRGAGRRAGLGTGLRKPSFESTFF